ncbi:DUF368 domain-containing protein [Propionicicella superfundia]|uniref:DUF368 domain-containing protein n=1 Tax=Propionicicella superfundia TaxID=348582 RepID=UPI0003F5193C|nr:DUF368 domain-containing protein [Propionicicella superfundia]
MTGRDPSATDLLTNDIPDVPASGGPTSPVDPVTAPDSAPAWFLRLLKGVVIGIGAILPGLSGGVLAVVFAVYDPLIRFFADMRRNFSANVRFLAPIVLGAGIGILLFSLVVEAAFGRFAAQFTCLFIGFVIGTVPSLYHQAGRRGRTRRHLVVLGVSALGIASIMILGGGLLVAVTPSIPVWLGSGALIGLGLVVPGLSPSNFLLYFGLYDKMAAGIGHLDPAVVLPLGAGVVGCTLLLAKGAAWLFDHHHAGMYHFIVGTVVGSSLALVPVVVLPAFTPSGLAASGLGLGVAVAFGAAMLILGVLASYLFGRFENGVERRRAGA